MREGVGERGDNGMGGVGVAAGGGGRGRGERRK